MIVTTRMRKHDHNDKYTKREVCEEKHKNVDDKIVLNTQEILSINRKIDATLAFTIGTLIAVIVGLLSGQFH